MRAGTTLLAILVLGLAAVPRAGAYTMVLKSGDRVELSDFLVLGESVEGTLAAGSPWSTTAEAVDYRATYLANLESEREKGVYLARGKVLTFDDIKTDDRTATLILSDTGIVILPLEALDFKTTVIEGRGRRAGASLRGARTGGSRPSPTRAAAPRGAPQVARNRPILPRSPDEEEPPEEAPFEEAPFEEAPPEEPTFPEEPEQIEQMGGGNSEDPQTMREAFARAFEGRETEQPGDPQPAKRITRAEVVQKVDPIFDPALVPEGRGLTALMEVTVTTSGTVGNVKVIKSTGKPELDAAGVDAIQQYIYNPAQKDGVPFESRRLERITFRAPR